MAKGTLEVLLMDAQGIKDRESLLGCFYCLNPCNAIKLYPYVVIQYGNQELTSCVADQEGKKLVWNEKLTLNLEYPTGEDEDQTYKLVLRIMDKHKISDDNLVGETTIYIKDVLSLGAEKGKAELRAQKYRVVLADQTYSGEISVAVTFTVDV